MDKETRKYLKKYAKISNIATSVFVTIIMGVVVGWVIDEFFETTIWQPICICLFTLFAIINFFRGVIKLEKEKK